MCGGVDDRWCDLQWETRRGSDFDEKTRERADTHTHVSHSTLFIHPTMSNRTDMAVFLLYVCV